MGQSAMIMLDISKSSMGVSSVNITTTYTNPAKRTNMKSITIYQGNGGISLPILMENNFSFTNIALSDQYSIIFFAGDPVIRMTLKPINSNDTVNIYKPRPGSYLIIAV